MKKTAIALFAALSFVTAFTGCATETGDAEGETIFLSEAWVIDEAELAECEYFQASGYELAWVVANGDLAVVPARAPERPLPEETGNVSDLIAGARLDDLDDSDKPFGESREDDEELLASERAPSSERNPASDDVDMSIIRDRNRLDDFADTDKPAREEEQGGWICAPERVVDGETLCFAGYALENGPFNAFDVTCAYENC